MSQKKFYRTLLATATAAAIVTSTVIPAASIEAAPYQASAETRLATYLFTDVSKKYEDAVQFVYEKGILGFSTTRFGVEEMITRVDAAVMLAKVLELDVENAKPSGFKDVPSRGVKYVNALKEAGITSGKSKTEFGSYSNITRGELAMWIQKAYDLKGEGQISFLDVSSKYKEAVTALVKNGITQGVNSKEFGTNNPAKRGDYAIFLYRANALTPELKETKRYFISF